MGLAVTPGGDVKCSSAIRFDEVYAAVVGVIDPCSESMGRPLSLLEMNLLRCIDVTEESVFIGVALTEPTCMYTFAIVEQITEAIRARLGDQVKVKVELSSDLPNEPWTEAQLSAVAASRLKALRDGDRASLETAGLTNDQKM